MTSPLYLYGRHVTLRPFTVDEAEPMVPAVMRWVTAGDSEASVRDGLRERAERSGTMTERGIDLGIEVGGKLVGDVQARSEGLPKGAYELGIGVFDEADRGKGYGGEAISLLTAHLFDAEEAHRVQLSTDVANLAMRVAAERAGFGFEGILRGFWPEPDGPHDYAMFAVTRADHERRTLPSPRA